MKMHRNLRTALDDGQWGGRGQDEGGASAKRGAATRLANGPTLASHLKVLGVYHVVVHSFFIRPALNGIVST